jgi:N6-adenosine-specific RNA methylase IME4/ParB-like chromosome segregation protein Spo0J
MSKQKRTVVRTGASTKRNALACAPRRVNVPKAGRQVLVGISKIKIGKRHRKDMGDIAALASDLADINLLEPIVVRPIGPDCYELVCGERRLRAAKLNGQTNIQATVRHFTDAEMVRAEFSENTHRKDFTLSEAVAIKRALEPLEKAAAKERQAASGGKGRIASGKLPTATTGRAADKAARATGRARRTLEKAEAVVAAAEAEPERFGKLQADMDRTGCVDGPFKRLKVMRQAALIRAEPPPYPGRGPYRVGVADVPWPYEVRQEDPSHRATHPYPQMSIDQMCAEGKKVRSIMHPDSIMWFWVPNYHLVTGHHLPVLSAWGFEPVNLMTWVKDRFGHGDVLRGQSEHAILATRGKANFDLPALPTVFSAPVRGNSHKPDKFFDLVEQLCPASRYCYLFAREFNRPNWDCHGDEASPAVRVDAKALATVIEQVPRIRAENHAAARASGLPGYRQGSS